MTDFDFQWANLPSPFIELNQDRIEEFKNFTNISLDWFKGKKCLDAGCGSGRYTWVLQQLGAEVTSIDESIEAVKKCKEINPNTFQLNLFDLKERTDLRGFDFVISWGVLHHTPNPVLAFNRVAETVKKGGIFHVYLYHENSQEQYKQHRINFKSLNTIPEKMAYVQNLCKGNQGMFHSWWDALVPTFNWGLNVPMVEGWFKTAGFKDIKVVTQVNINMNATKI